MNIYVTLNLHVHVQLIINKLCSNLHKVLLCCYTCKWQAAFSDGWHHIWLAHLQSAQEEH